MKPHFLLSLAFAVTATLTANAADAPAPVPAELLSCAAISRSSERLACFDHVVAALAAGKPVSGPGATPESSFGLLSSPSLPPAKEAAAARGDLESVSSVVKGFARANDGSLVVQLENGQSWKQISGSDPLLRAGDTVTINRAALGSFQMVVPSGRSAKVRRVQ